MASIMENMLNTQQNMATIQNTQEQNQLLNLSIQQKQQDMQRQRSVLEAIQKAMVNPDSEGASTASQAAQSGQQADQYGKQEQILNKLAQVTMAIDPATGMQYAESAAKIGKERMSAQKDQLANQLQNLQVSTNLIDSARDQTSYDLARATAIQNGFKLPPGLTGNFQQDKPKLDLMKRGLMDQSDALKMQHDRVEESLKLQEIRDKEELQRSQIRLNDARTANARAGVGGVSDLGDEGMSDLIGLARSGLPKSQVVGGYGKDASRIWAKVESGAIRQIMDENPDMSRNDAAKVFAGGGVDLKSQTKAVQAFATGRQGDTVRSFNVADSHLETLSELADALHNNDIKKINQVSNRWQEETGGTPITNFEAAKRIVGDEITKAIIGSRGALADREEAAKTINAAQSPEQLKGVINTYKSLIGGQMKGLKQQYETSTGRKDWNKFLTEQTKQDMGGKDKKTYSVGDTVEHGGKKYRVVGGDPADPDVEPIE